MKLHILMNALDYGDAVSTHCILLKQRARELGIAAFLYAEFTDPQVSDHVTPLSFLSETAAPDDVLLHQLFNATSLMPYAGAFPGPRVLMYHNITPPEYFSPGGEVHTSCVNGLKLLGSLTGTYDYAVGMSEFSRRNLEDIGYKNTGVFPLLLDLDGLRRLVPDSTIMRKPKPAATVLLFVGRVAPNKRVDDLLRCLAAYRSAGYDACLRLVGDDKQHPEYVNSLHRLSLQLGLKPGLDVIFTGKVPESHLVAYYRTADAFLCMSEHEGFCAPLIESMAFGLPTFTYAAGACEETVGAGGFVFRHKDFPRIARTIGDVLHDSAKLEEMVARQRRRVEDFGAEAQKERLASLLHRFEDVAVPVRDDKKVSIVINTCNRGQLLERCLAGLGDQTYRNFEVVVVNGPSTDETSEVLARFAGQIRVVNTDSRVLCVSRNEGILQATGELIAFIDDDALADPRWVERLVSAFDDASVGAAGGLVYRMSGRDIEFRNGILDRHGFVRWNEPRPGEQWNWENGFLNTVSGNNCMFRRSALERIGGFDERIEYYHDEADVVMRLAKAGFRTVHRPEAVVYHESAKSHNRPNKYELNWFAIVKNTIYCALKNYDGDQPRRKVAARIVGEIFRERMLPMIGWWRSGNIRLFSLLRLEMAAAKGIAVGLRRSFRPLPLHRQLPPLAEDTEFRMFTSGKPRKGLSVCLLSQTLPDESPGGIATYTWNLALGLNSLGCEVHIVTRGANTTDECRGGIWIHRAEALVFEKPALDGELFPTMGKNLEYSNGVRAAIQDVDARWGVDLIESPNWDAEGLLSAMEHCHPIVVRVHSPMFKVMEVQGWEETEDLRLCSEMEGVLIRHAQTVTGSTRAILSLVGNRFRLDGKAALVPLGIDSPQMTRKELASNGHGGTKCVLFVGRLELRKGVHTLLEAMPRVLAAAPGSQFEIVGKDGRATEGGTWQEHWKAKGAGFGDRVRFRGEVNAEELDELYAACDVFVAPSQYESFGLIYLEAMAHSKPVVACNAGGIPEVVVDGETGVLVPVDDPSALAEALLRLLRNEELCRRLGTAGRALYEEHFSASVMATRTLEVYSRTRSAWTEDAGLIWRGRAPDFFRHPDCNVVWVPETGNTCLLVNAGQKCTAVYGPYVDLAPGTYRAQFKLWIGSPAGEPGPLGTVQVFNLRHEMKFNRVLTGEDFSAGQGRRLDIFFSVSESDQAGWEFRVMTEGVVPIYIREIVVGRWPHPSLTKALGEAELTPVQLIQPEAAACSTN